jgi:RNA polymerase sigma-70 factor (ECF subfamily)
MTHLETPMASPSVCVETRAEPGPELLTDMAVSGATEAAPARPTFDSVYHAWAPFVWRNARRLGVPFGAVEDVMQEVFLVVYRKLPEFEERTSVRAWLSAILINVVRAHRRSARRKDPTGGSGLPSPEPDSLTDVRSQSPLQAAERDEAVRELYSILARMNEKRREVLVLSELEELSAREIAQALQVNVNTVSWRLQTARREFERMVLRRSKVERNGTP